jgi:cold-inducible RNA-binding protein
MGRRLYVGNLPYKATEEELRELFGRAGAVAGVQVMRDAMTGRARGFAFVEMATEEGAQKAISEFHDYQMDGRALVVNEAPCSARFQDLWRRPSGLRRLG